MIMEESSLVGTVETVGQMTLSSGLLMPDTTALKRRIAAIEGIIDDLFVEGTHYGQPFPGSDKKSLLQPGAELITEAFGLSPEPVVTFTDEGGGHRGYLCEGELLSNGVSIGTMSAECTTRESKYRYRKGGRVCPACGKEGSIIPSRFEDCKWFCFEKKGGCNAKFQAGDEAIEKQVTGRVENEDPADVYHTARMMAQKRWLVAITRRTFALSARFVDADMYAKQSFDWKGKGGELLRALPGDKKEIWARVGRYTLREFGKEPKTITNLEGGVLMDWLRGNAGGAVAADTSPPDTSPVAPPATREPEGGGHEEAPVRGQGGMGYGEPPSLLQQELAAPDEPPTSPEPTLAVVNAALDASNLHLEDVTDEMKPPLRVNSTSKIPKARLAEFLDVVQKLGAELRHVEARGGQG